MKIKGIVFDFNGTLFMDNEYHYLAWKVIVEDELHMSLTTSIKEKLYGSHNKDILYAIKPSLTEAENDYYSKKKEEIYRAICKSKPEYLHLVAGATNFFDKLQKCNIPFTIASASIKDNINFFIEVFSLDRWFDIDKIVYDDGTYLDKVNMFKDACEHINVLPKDCLVIEDSKAGITAAKKAGIGRIIGIGPYEEHKKLQALQVDACITDFEDIPW